MSTFILPKGAKNLTGKMINGSEVLRPISSVKNHGILWLIKCVCGKKFQHFANQIGKLKNISCGCKRGRKSHPITRQRFGIFVAIALIDKSQNELRYGRNRRHRLWRLQCDCGNEHVCPASELKLNKVVSCGCSYKRNGKYKKKHYKTYDQTQVGKDYRRNLNLQFKYGLTIEQFQEMKIAQDNKCAICKSTPNKELVVDHDHLSGEVRQLLCYKCNTGLGLFNENPDLLIEVIKYIERHKNDSLRLAS